MSVDPLLDYLERTFSDAYRKEIDQEENVWRSLPFFAATLALQLAGLAQIRDWLAGVGGALLVVVAVLLGVAGLATLAAILFLARSVWPADYQYLQSEPAFYAYAQDVQRQADTEGVVDGKSAEGRAVLIIKTVLAEQYAAAAGNNRAINQRRARWRTRAGLATLASVFVVLVLVSLVVVSNFHGYAR